MDEWIMKEVIEYVLRVEHADFLEHILNEYGIEDENEGLRDSRVHHMYKAAWSLKGEVIYAI
jgi:hypothetical protein